ncbi:expressed unknown protein [Seminavis robusta]|uniref:Uncharacterized protein n=1 Tax=Seminavis robusta TaxID=568900 RepID=A0A9N8EWY8_9STRA|nr:expressed unknown protein [Seminavis robusta]|eukprot:Sro2318_g323050.1 n/a (95) ;mRNA; f:4896-5280
MMIGRSAVLRTTKQVAARRLQSTAGTPKMHKAKDCWQELEKTRAPKDHDDLHLVFHPPYNFAVTTSFVIGIAAAGWGLMAFGSAHQQYKQGYWK